MTFFMPAPGIIGGGGGAVEPPVFVNASTPVYGSGTGGNLKGPLNPVAGNLGLVLHMQGYSGSLSWTRSGWDDINDGNYSTVHSGNAIWAGTNSSTSGLGVTFAHRELTGAEGSEATIVTDRGGLGTNLWGSVALQFSGVKTTAPLMDYPMVGKTCTADNNHYYAALAASTLQMPIIKVAGPGRLGVAYVLKFTASATGKTTTPPAGWTQVAVLSTTIGVDAVCEVYTKPLDVDEPAANWTLSGSTLGWSVGAYALSPKGADDLWVPNYTSMQNRGASLGSTTGVRISGNYQNSVWSSETLQLASNHNKNYFEMYVNFSNGPHYGLHGIHNDPLYFTSGAGLAGTGFGVQSNAGIQVSNVTLQSNPAYSYNSGDTLMFAHDRTAGRVWIGKNGSWSITPDTGNGNISGLTGAGWYPSMGGFFASNTVIIRLYDHELFYSKPAGYTAYGDP